MVLCINTTKCQFILYMIDVCADYDGTDNKLFQDEGYAIQTLSVTLEKCQETCIEHQGCNSLSYCSDKTPVECNFDISYSNNCDYLRFQSLFMKTKLCH